MIRPAGVYTSTAKDRLMIEARRVRYLYAPTAYPLPIFFARGSVASRWLDKFFLNNE